MDNNRSHRAKLAFLFAVILGFFGIFFLVPTLRPVSLLTILNVLLLAPFIQFLERKKMPRAWAIIAVFSVVGIFVMSGIVFFTQVVSDQWRTVLDILPQYADRVLDRLHGVRARIEDSIGFQIPISANGFQQFGQSTQSWFINNFPEILGGLASAIFLVPIFSFFLLKDSEEIFHQFFKMVPSAYSKTSTTLIKKTIQAMSEYIRAKFLEAFLVGLMTFVGLKLVGTPYAIIFAIIAAITNIVPYIGPILGALPAILVAAFTDPAISIWPTVIVFIVVNAIDMLFIFPVLVGKLVNLSPLVLLVAVAVGQEFYGVVGMLIAVPIASILKILYHEFYELIYVK